MQQNERLGIVARMVGDSGLGYIKEEGPEGGDYSFTCDAYAKYHGEKLSDLKRFSPGGLRPGVRSSVHEEPTFHRCHAALRVRRVRMLGGHVPVGPGVRRGVPEQ